MNVSKDQSERVPVSDPVEQPRERAGLSLGRIINGAILLIHVATFITSLCVIGLVGYLMDQIGRVPPPSVATKLGSCPFFAHNLASNGDTSYTPLAPNGVCLWFIAGHTIIAIAVIVFFIIGVVRIVFAMDIGFGTIAELIATPILFVLAFAVAVSISIGIPVTCGNLLTPSDCPNVAFPNGTKKCGTSSDICWYANAKSAEAAAWIIHIFFIVFFAVNIARLVIFIRRRKEDKRRRQLVEYDTADDTPPAPV